MKKEDCPAPLGKVPLFGISLSFYVIPPQHTFADRLKYLHTSLCSLGYELWEDKNQIIFLIIKYHKLIYEWAKELIE